MGEVVVDDPEQLESLVKETNSGHSLPREKSESNASSWFGRIQLISILLAIAAILVLAKYSMSTSPNAIELRRPSNSSELDTLSSIQPQTSQQKPIPDTKSDQEHVVPETAENDSHPKETEAGETEELEHASDAGSVPQQAGETQTESEQKPETGMVPQKSESETSETESQQHKPGKTEFPTEKPGYKRPERQYSESYVRRGKPITQDLLAELGEKWGKWTLVDEKADQRPKEDYFVPFSNRDIPRDEFPAEAWQLDTDYLSKFLPEGIELVDRAMETILGEYGHSKFDEPDKPFEERTKMFSLSFVDSTGFDDEAHKDTNIHGREDGGWMPARSYNSLVRRLLHAIMTEDSFTFTMGGHSASAGHGNHFQQSYTLQLQRVMEPIFARLGVHFEAHNIGMGGLGTIHNAMASGDVYGRENDILMWDSGMTEKEESVYEVFARQGLLSGNRVPILWGGQPGSLRRLFENADAEVGHVGDIFGCCRSGIPMTMDPVQALDLPWAARYLECGHQDISLCTDRETKFNATCWIDRPDGFEPPNAQQIAPGGQASWHPGNRRHQLASRALAFAILFALRDALHLWQDAEEYVLSDNSWHVTSHYENIRLKVLDSDDDENLCLQANTRLQAIIPHSFCRYPVKGRSEFLPRNNPAESSIRSIMKHGEYFPGPEPNIYDPPDVFIPNLEVPDGVIDYLNIVENGVDFVPSRARRKKVALRKSQIGQARGYSADKALIKPGIGWSLNSQAASDFCDGTYDSFCGRDANSKCLLYAHNDYRGGLWFDGLSGWIVLQLDKVEHGTIVVKIEFWHKGNENPRTNDWTCENNDCNGRELETTSVASDSTKQGLLRTEDSTQRRLDGGIPECEDGEEGWTFEYAIDGKITTWTGTEFEKRRVRPKRNIDIWTLLEDPEFARDGPKDVELAIRMTGCLTRSMLLTHVYWQ